MPVADNGDHVSLRDFVERIILEHDRINTMRLDNAKQEIQALRSTVEAYEKSSERAVTVSRDAQQKVAEKANEFRAALDDANKNNISRSESAALINGLDDKIADFRTASEADRAGIKQLASERTDTLNKQIAAINLMMSNFLPIKDYEKGRSELMAEISGLRESRSAAAGQGAGTNALIGYVALAVSVIAGLLAIASRFTPSP